MEASKCCFHCRSFYACTLIFPSLLPSVTSLKDDLAPMSAKQSQSGFKRLSGTCTNPSNKQQHRTTAAEADRITTRARIKRRKLDHLTAAILQTRSSSPTVKLNRQTCPSCGLKGLVGSTLVRCAAAARFGEPIADLHQAVASLSTRMVCGAPLGGSASRG